MTHSRKLNRATTMPDLMSGLTVALAIVPEGMASTLTTGVHPEEQH